jgi:hypothetical protein
MLRSAALLAALAIMAWSSDSASAQGHHHHGQGHHHNSGYHGGGHGHSSNFSIGINYGNPYGGFGYSSFGYGCGHNVYRPVYAVPVMPVYGGYPGYYGRPVYGGGCGGHHGGGSIFFNF